MMKEIYARGPITCSFVGTDAFMFNYSTNEGVLREGVYLDETNYSDKEVDHNVEVVGWGVTPDGTKYWVIRNSWGTYWGDMGWFKVSRGVNQQHIEDPCDWAVPTFDGLDEELKGQVLGSYISGITVVSGPANGAQALV